MKAILLPNNLLLIIREEIVIFLECDLLNESVQGKSGWSSVEEFSFNFVNFMKDSIAQFHNCEILLDPVANPIFLTETVQILNSEFRAWIQ